MRLGTLLLDGKRRPAWLCFLLTLCSLMLPCRAEDNAGVEFFESKIRPVLVERCYSCHSAESEKVKGELRVDSREGMLKGGETGPIIVPGDPEKSSLIRAIRYIDDNLLMPPKKKLSPQQVADFEAWVKMGAPDPRTNSVAAAKPKFDLESARKFWSFQPVKMPSVPNNAGRTEIDKFIQAGLEAKNLKTMPLADKRTLLRRATYDLTGLPPTPDEVRAFESDSSPDAFAKVIDRLLTSPAYGERCGRHWLDVVRYADTAGETADYPVPLAFRYRNYVIDAFNKDKPYDEFLREQIAGDILAANGPREKYAERVVATGYLAISRRFGFDSENYMHLTIEDTIDTFGKSLLGLSMGCARCHDHKFDPLTMSDYYGLYGFFSSTRYAFPGSEQKKRSHDMVPMRPQSEIDELMKPINAALEPIDAELKALDAERVALEKDSKARAQKPPAPAGAGANETPAQNTNAAVNVADALKLNEARIKDARKRRDAVLAKAPKIDKAYAVCDGTPQNARIQRRGDPLNLGDEVPRHFPGILGNQTLPSENKGSGRLQLAEWLVSPANPLTARVMVNRIWQFHFGRGLVQTPNDFGKRGSAPTHPELLDYLAKKFVANGWSIKSMHRIMMLSDAYQRASGDDAQNSKIDVANDYLWRFNSRRLDAEEIRDTILVLSGTLDRTPAQEHPFPAEDSWNFTQHNPFTAVYETEKRSVYLMTQRIKRHPYLALFDGADPNSSTPQRRLTTVPTQALFFMNDPFVFAKAAKFADRALNSSKDENARIEFIYQNMFGRAPSSDERTEAANFLKTYSAELAKTNGKNPEQSTWNAFVRVLFSSNEFIHVD